MRLLHNHLDDYPKTLKTAVQKLIGYSLLRNLREEFGTTEFFDSVLPYSEILKEHIKRSTGYIPPYLLWRRF